MKKQLYLISGTNRGIGKQLLEEALGLGFTVWSLNRTLSDTEHPNHVQLKVDLSEVATVLEMLESHINRTHLEPFERVVFIANAGTLHPMNKVGHWSPRTFAQAITTNFTTTAIIANHLLSVRPKSSNLVLSYVTSGAARNSYPGWSMYGSSKAALHHFFQTIKVEVEDQASVQVIGLNPGKTETAMQEEIRATHKNDFPLAGYFRQAHEEGVLNDARSVASFFIQTLEQPITSGEVVAYQKQS